jgi:hypothetical protein
MLWTKWIKKWHPVFQGAIINKEEVGSMILFFLKFIPGIVDQL